MTPSVFPGQLFFRGADDGIYDVIGFMPSGLYLDVGAAAGKVTRRLAKVPGSRVIAFEPFDGNLEHFRRNTIGLSNVQLIESAVSDFDGPGRLFVASTLKGVEKGWEAYKGYSSSGTLIGSAHPRWNDARTDEVSVVSIDAMVSEPVRALKIDVQGGELGVLRGASNALRRGVDVIYMEFEGDAETLTLLSGLGYVLIDSGIYVYSPKAGSPPAAALSDAFKTTKLSSGREVFKGPLTRRPMALDEYTDFVRSAGEWALQTDIVAVHERAMPEFLRAVGEWQSSHS